MRGLAQLTPRRPPCSPPAPRWSARPPAATGASPTRPPSPSASSRPSTAPKLGDDARKALDGKLPLAPSSSALKVHPLDALKAASENASAHVRAGAMEAVASFGDEQRARDPAARAARSLGQRARRGAAHAREDRRSGRRLRRAPARLAGRRPGPAARRGRGRGLWQDPRAQPGPARARPRSSLFASPRARSSSSASTPPTPCAASCTPSWPTPTTACGSPP